jgi:hypothetical protein
MKHFSHYQRPCNPPPWVFLLFFPSICTDIHVCDWHADASCLRTIILTKADGTLASEAVSPEAVELNIALTHLGVSDQQPGTKDTLGQDIQNSVGNDLAIDTNPAGAIGKTPDTGTR